MMTRHSKFFSLIGFFLCLAGAPARAQGIIFPQPLPPNRPAPAQPLSIRSQKVTMQMTDGAVKVEVEQVFYNPNGVAMEGTYLFPLPAGATVSNFRMTVDKEPTEGKLLTVDEARKVYESYVRRNVDPGILEWVGRNAFRARVFPIPANGEKRIYLIYSQIADYSGGIYRVSYPLNSERVTGPSLADLVVEGTIRSTQPLRTVYSPSHEIQVKRDNDHLAHISFEGKEVRANRDLAIFYTTSEKAFGLNALAHRRPGEDGYVLLMLAPKQEVSSTEVQPKDVVFVFDTSGSMQGAKIDQARKALQTMLGRLNERDRFTVIRFSSEVAAFKDMVVPATTENRAAAKSFVDEFKAVGGTAIDDALQAALAAFPKAEERAGRAPFIIFMTDGLPTIGQTDVDRILQNAVKAAPADLRLFPFGVGADVNTLLLDRLAVDHRGAADYIADGEDLDSKIGGFYAKISDPILSNVQVALTGAELKDVHPRKIPDVFAGTQLLLLGRYKGAGKVSVTLTGDLNGKPQKYTYDLTLPERETGQDFIPKLWASRRIGFLLEEIRLHGENQPGMGELKDEVIRLSKEYGIVTPYTSYLVEEPNLVPGRPVPGGVVRLGEQEALSLDAARLNRGLGTNGQSNFGLRGAQPQAGGLGGGAGGGGFGGGQPADRYRAMEKAGASNLPRLGSSARPVDPQGRPGEEKAGLAGRTAQGPAGPRGPAVPPATTPQQVEEFRRQAQNPVAGKPATKEAADRLSAGVRMQQRAKADSRAAGASTPARPQVMAKVPLQETLRENSQYFFDMKEAETNLRYRQQAEGFNRSTGWNAVEASKRVQSLKDRAQADGDVEVSRNIEGRVFRNQNGAWVDQSATGKLTLVPVKFGSDAYFALVAARPEWARYLSAGREVTFRTGKSTAVVVGEKGKEKLTAAEIRGLEK